MDHPTPPLSKQPLRRAAPPTLEQQEAERACEDLLLRIRAAADDAMEAAGPARVAACANLRTIVGQYAACSRAAGAGSDEMVKPLRRAFGAFFYACTEDTDALVRHAVLSYFDLAE